MMALSISTYTATTAPPGTLNFLIHAWMNSCHKNKQHGTLYYVLFLQLGREVLVANTQTLQVEKSQYHAAAFFEQDSCSILVCTYTCVLQTCSRSTVIQFEMDT